MKKMNINSWQNKILKLLLFLGIAGCLFLIRSQWDVFYPKDILHKAFAGKTFGSFNDDYARNIIKTKDGGFLMIGETLSTDGDVTGNQSHDGWLIKLDAKLNLQWQKTVGGSASDEVKTVIETKDGNFAIIGSTQSSDGGITDNHGDFDYWFIKIAPNGKILWQKCFGGSLEDRAFDAVQVKTGGYLLTGTTYSDDGDVKEKFIGKDIWLVRIDEDGEVLWQRKLGGIDNEAFKVLQTSDEGFLMVGYTPGTNSVLDDDGASEHDALMVKFSRYVKIEWLKTLGGSDEDQATAVIETSNHDYLIAGWTRSHDGDMKRNYGSSDYWAAKLNRAGDLLWLKTYGGSKSDRAASIIETEDNHYLIAGETRSNDGNVKNNHGGVDAWVIRINHQGRLLSQGCFGGSQDDLTANIINSGRRDSILLGSTNSTDGDIQTNRGKNDFWVLKFQ